jgi:hypothetical protein
MSAGMSCYKSAVNIYSSLTRYVAPATSLVRCFAGQVRRPRDPLFLRYALVMLWLCSGYALVMLWLCSGCRAVICCRGEAPIGLSNVVPAVGGRNPPNVVPAVGGRTPPRRWGAEPPPPLGGGTPPAVGGRNPPAVGGRNPLRST